MSYSTLDNAIITDMDGGGSMKLQFMPDTITDSKRANFTDYVILGRSSPLKGYQNGPSRTIEFTAVFFASPHQENPSPTPGEIKTKVDWLMSLPYPDYSAGIMPPHRCFVQIGENVSLIAVCTAASVTYRKGIPWDLGPGLVHGAEVSLSFEEVKDVPVDVYDVRGGNG